MTDQLHPTGQTQTRETGQTITIHVQRFRPESEAEPTMQTFTIPYQDDIMVLDALNYIKERQDGSLAYRWSCRMGICGSCGMLVNGKPRLTCNTLLREFAPGPVTIEPLTNFPIIRDLVIDLSDFIIKLDEIRPYIIREDEKPVEAGEYLQTPAERERYAQYSQCINCMLCYAACPVYGISKQHFLGPAAIALARRYNLDTRDKGRAWRELVLYQDEGIWECTYVGECSEACPKGVDPAKAIQQTKVEGTLGWYTSLLTPWRK